MSSENSTVVENAPTQPAASAPQPLRLVMTRAQASREISAQIKIGQAIQNQRIRSPRELEEARSERNQWMSRSSEMLGLIFNSTTVAERWLAFRPEVLPDYAEFDLFANAFVDEMKSRIGGLNMVLSKLPEIPEPGPLIPGAPAPVIPTAPVPPVEAADAAKPSRAEFPTVVTKTRTVALVCRNLADPLCSALARFLTRLNLEMTHAETATALEDQNAPTFALLISGEAGPEASMFELGFCAGRLGTQHVCVIHQAGQAGGDLHGVAQLAIDAADTESWHLALARQLRKGGVDVDLNKLI